MDSDASKRVGQFLDRTLNLGRALSLPPALNRCLEDFGTFRLGDNWWANGAQTQTLDSDLLYLSQRWLDSATPPAYSQARYVAYALGFLPLGFLKIARLLNRLSRRVPFPDRLEILDIGCGPGTASLSALHFFDQLSHATRLLAPSEAGRHLSFTALDANPEAAPIYGNLMHGASRYSDLLEVELSEPVTMSFDANVDWASSPVAGRSFDLILIQNVLGEARHVSTSSRSKALIGLASMLKPTGAILLVEGSGAGHTQEFHQVVSRSVEGGLNLLWPCSTLTARPQGVPCYSCGSHIGGDFDLCRLSSLVASSCPSYDLAQRVEANAWCAAVFRFGDETEHPVLSADGFLPLAEIASRPELTTVDVQACVASLDGNRAKLCDQSCGAETVQLRWEEDKVLPPLEVGDVLQIKGARVTPIAAEAGGRQRLELVVGLEGASVSNLSAMDRTLAPETMFGGEPFRA